MHFINEVMVKSGRYRHVAKRRRVTAGRSSNSSTVSGMRRLRANLGRATRFVRAARRAGRYSNNKTRRSGSSQLNEPDGMGGSQSAKYYKLYSSTKIPKGMKAMAAPLDYRYNAAGRLTSTQGQQGAYTILDLLDGIDVQACMGMLFPSSLTGFQTGLGMITGSTVETRFTNQSKGNVCLHLYDIVPRKNIETGQLTYFDVITSWATGMSIGNTTTSTTAVSYTNLNSTPFDSPLFTRYYKITKVTKLIMAQGCCHIHKVHVKGNRPIMYANDGLASNIIRYDRDFTKLTLAVVSGFPLNESGDTSHVSTATTAVDWVSSVRIKMRGYQGSLSHLSYSVVLPTLSDEHVMDKGSGEAEANAQA